MGILSKTVLVCLFCLMLKEIAACKIGWSETSRSCVWFSGDKGTWDYAKETCLRIGAFLAEPETLGDLNELRHLAEDKDGGKTGYWIGGSDRRSEGYWFWFSTNKFIDLNVLNWNSGQPDNSGNDENCLFLNDKSTEFRMNDKPCAHLFNFICEALLDTTTYVHSALDDDISPTNVITTKLVSSEQAMNETYNITTDINSLERINHEDSTSKPASGTEFDYTSSTAIIINSTKEINHLSTTIDSSATIDKSTSSLHNTGLCACSCDYKQKLIDSVSQIIQNRSYEDLKIDLEPILTQITDNLRVNRTKLSSYIRRKTSASDNRKSSKHIGYGGAVVLGIVLTLIILDDVATIMKCTRRKNSNIIDVC